MLPRAALGHALMLGGAVALAQALWPGDQLPADAALDPAVRQAPLRLLADPAPLQRALDGRVVVLRPLADVEWSALVVRRQAPPADDGPGTPQGPAVVDWCVVFGANVQDERHRALVYVDAEPGCAARPRSPFGSPAVDPQALAALRLLAFDPGLAERLRAVRVGDQLRVKGWVVEPLATAGTTPAQFARDPGAPEWVDVQEMQLLQPAPQPGPPGLLPLAGVLFLLGWWQWRRGLRR